MTATIWGKVYLSLILSHNFYFNLKKNRAIRTNFFVAPGGGIEPPANWLTANCSTAELPGMMEPLPFLFKKADLTCDKSSRSMIEIGLFVFA